MCREFESHRASSEGVAQLVEQRKFSLALSSSGGIGRRIALKMLRETVPVQVRPRGPLQKYFIRGN